MGAMGSSFSASPEEEIAAASPWSVGNPSAQFAVPAEHYDRFMGRYAPTLAAALADAAGVTPGMRVLDVGCGPGGLTSELCRRVGAEAVAAIDPASRFVAACRERHRTAEVRQGVAEQLPWPDGEFDAALSCLVIGSMSDPDRGVRETARVTRPGGRAGTSAGRGGRRTDGVRGLHRLR
jgi:ubiquinone/menaquinone biosynthesis C-methylase UbiE